MSRVVNPREGLKFGEEEKEEEARQQHSTGILYCRQQQQQQWDAQRLTVSLQYDSNPSVLQLNPLQLVRHRRSEKGRAPAQTDRAQYGRRGKRAMSVPHVSVSIPIHISTDTLSQCNCISPATAKVIPSTAALPKQKKKAAGTSSQANKKKREKAVKAAGEFTTTVWV